MEPGLELDALVAREVMGWTMVNLSGTPEQYKWYWQGGNTPSGPKVSSWSPTTSIQHAIEVLEKIKPPSQPATITWLSDSREWTVQVGLGKGEVWASAPTLPHAICLASLKAKESDKVIALAEKVEKELGI